MKIKPILRTVFLYLVFLFILTFNIDAQNIHSFEGLLCDESLGKYGFYCDGQYDRQTDFSRDLSAMKLTEFTITCEFQSEESRSQWVFVLSHGYRHFGYHINQDNSIQLIAKNFSVGKSTNTMVHPNNWYLATITFKNNIANIYLNSEKIGTIEVIFKEDYSEKDKIISTTNYGNGEAFKGFIRNFKVYDRALNKEEIAFLSKDLPTNDPADPGSVRNNHFTYERASFIDRRDNASYKTIRVGDKIWMAENLNYNLDGKGSYFYPKRMLNSSQQQIDDALRRYSIDQSFVVGLENQTILTKINPYLNQAIKENPKGWRYYTYEASRTACPTGWRLPTDEEWNSLNYHTDSIFSYFRMPLSRWTRKLNNPILDIDLKNEFGKSTKYWSGTDSGRGAHIIESNNLFQPLDMEILQDFNEVGFCIRCVKDVTNPRIRYDANDIHTKIITLNVSNKEKLVGTWRLQSGDMNDFSTINFDADGNVRIFNNNDEIEGNEHIAFRVVSIEDYAQYPNFPKEKVDGNLIAIIMYEKDGTLYDGTNIVGPYEIVSLTENELIARNLNDKLVRKNGLHYNPTFKLIRSE